MGGSNSPLFFKQSNQAKQMNNSNPIVAHNVRHWRDEKGLTAREHETARIRAEREAKERADALNAQKTGERMAKASRLAGGKVPQGAVDVRFRCGRDGRGGRVCWQWLFAPVIA